MVKLSVIVPVYNVEKYLEKCLDSILNQTLNDIEIIIVNDGTKDNSQKIIDKYKKNYKNILLSNSDFLYILFQHAGYIDIMLLFISSLVVKSFSIFEYALTVWSS